MCNKCFLSIVIYFFFFWSVSVLNLNVKIVDENEQFDVRLLQTTNLVYQAKSNTTSKSVSFIHVSHNFYYCIYLIRCCSIYFISLTKLRLLLRATFIWSWRLSNKHFTSQFCNHKIPFIQQVFCSITWCVERIFNKNLYCWFSLEICFMIIIISPFKSKQRIRSGIYSMVASIDIFNQSCSSYLRLAPMGEGGVKTSKYGMLVIRNLFNF